MTFFYDLNKRMAALAGKQDLAEGKKAKPDFLDADKDGNKKESFKKAVKDAEAGKVDEGLGDVVKKVGGMAKTAGNAVLNKVGHGDDADMIRDLQRKMGVPQTGMKPGAESNPKQVKEKMNPAKAKKFAALAEPKDKITFADKIAGAKKEVDEMLGDVAAEAMRNAVGNKKKVVADEATGNAFDYKSPRPTTGTGRFDVKKTSTGTVYTRKPETFSDEEGETSSSDGPKKRGRPAGPKKAPERVTSKAWKHKDGRKVKEEEMSEGNVSTGNLQKMFNLAVSLKAHCGPEGSELLKELTSLIKHYVNQTDSQLDEKAVSKKQQKFMGMVHATQKGEKAPSKEVAKVAKSMGKKDAEDFAATKHKGLPEKKKPEGKKKEKTEESGTTAGAVATASSSGKASKGMTFGKGVYESMDKRLESVINESMNISMNMSTDPDGGPKSLTVTATEADADKLAELLKMAGLGGHGHEETCDVCGSADCGCGDIEQAIDENAPDWPTNTETSGNALQYAGGLNKPKSTGQTTTPVIAHQGRQTSMEESVQLERSLFSLYNNYKAK